MRYAPRIRYATSVLTAALLSAGLPAAAFAEATNLATSSVAKASSQLRGNSPASNAIDGDASDDSRWISKDSGEHWLELEFSASFVLGSAHLYSGWHADSPVRNFELEYWDGQRWRDIPGAKFRNNDRNELIIPFSRPVETTKVRLLSDDRGSVRVKELLFWAPQPDGASPALGTGVTGASLVLAPDPESHYAIVNQVGYDLDGAKRFTAPHSPNGTRFTVTPTDSEDALFQGAVRGGVGDFTEFRPEDPEAEFVVRLAGRGKQPAVSDPFYIRPMMITDLSLKPALHFMIDSRSISGTHPSAYGGTPWRDGTYYTYEMPSLVLMYLANPAFFEALEPEIDYAADKARVLDPGFRWVRAAKDEGYLDAVREYYREIDPTVGERVPDIVELIHWGVGMYLVDPASQDPSGGPAGHGIHDQTIEQFAYFLYAYPHMSEYFTDRFYDQTLAFAREQWKATGLFELDTEYEGPKGRNAPGHSIMPNLMMHAVAVRDGLEEADAYLDAAAAQAEWVVRTLDPADPAISKGQRMSEHKLYTGLVMLMQEHPDRAPSGLESWLERWARVAVERSDNLYDLRMFNDSMWTLPKPWNEPGNIAGFPALTIAVADVIENPRLETRLAQLHDSHYDNLFGRNPLMAASSQRGAVDYPGLERGFPKKFHLDWCARLELCRGTLNSNAADEHFPFNPTAGFRHCEGWTAFNASFNVSLAYTSWDQTGWSVEVGEVVSAPQGLEVALTGPLGVDRGVAETVTLPVSADGQAVAQLTLQETGPATNRFEAALELPEFVRPPKQIDVSYGHGPWSRSLVLTLQEDGRYGVEAH